MTAYSSQENVAFGSSGGIAYGSSSGGSTPPADLPAAAAAALATLFAALNANTAGIRSWREGEDAATHYDPLQVAAAVKTLADPDLQANLAGLGRPERPTFRPAY